MEQAGDDQVRRLLDYVAATSDVRIGGAPARARLAAADAALALANNTIAPAEVVAACVKAVKDASATYYPDWDPARPQAFDDVLQDMIGRARARDTSRPGSGHQPAHPGRANRQPALPGNRASNAQHEQGPEAGL